MSESMLTKFKGVNVKMEVGTDDLLAIAVSHYEQGLIRQKRLLEKAFRSDSRSKAEKEKVLDRNTKSFLKVTIGKDLQTACSALESASMGRFGYDIRFGKIDLDEGAVSYTSIIKSSNGGYNRSSLSSDGESALPQHLLDLVTDINSLSDSLRNTATELMEVKSDLKGIATKERQARASLAITALQDSEDGLALLASLQSQNGGLFITDNS